MMKIKNILQNFFQNNSTNQISKNTECIQVQTKYISALLHKIKELENRVKYLEMKKVCFIDENAPGLFNRN